jgi:RNA polymerase sigma-70 factor (ECF subfamily)
VADRDQALATLLAERGTVLKRQAYLLCGGDAGAAEDLLQDALVRTLGRTLGHWEPGAVEGYVRRVMVNLSIDRHRRSVRWRRVLPLMSGRQDVPDPAPGVLSAQEMRTALGQLSPRQRACVVLRFYEDLPIAQVADALGCSQGGVKRHLKDALDRLAVVFNAAREDVS